MVTDNAPPCAPPRACEVPSGTAWQRFLPTGPIALLPVRGGHSNIVWSTPPRIAMDLERLTPQGFVDEVNKVWPTGPHSRQQLPSASTCC